MIEESLAIFISYAHEDEPLLKEFEKHLVLLKKQGFITTWHNRNISPGAEWTEDINTHLNTAQLILLLVSPDFLASDYCYSVELERAMQRHQAGEARVIPIILRPVDWNDASFGKLQALPTGGKPVTNWRGRHGRDNAFVSIVKSIRVLAKERESQKTPLIPAFSSIVQGENFIPNKISSRQFKSIFWSNQPLAHESELYGRKRERAILLNAVRSGSSISIVGPFCIGKTWLMNYLILVSAKTLGPQYRIVYLDATMPSCATVKSFLLTTLEQFGISPPPGNSDANGLLMYLERAIREASRRGEYLVLCIDEFEGLIGCEGFDVAFFQNFRALAQLGLSLVTATRQPLQDSLEKFWNDRQTSPFFNIFAQISIKPFNIEDARGFLHAKGEQAGFTEQEQLYILKYGQTDTGKWHPLRLQLAGRMLLEDKNLAIEEDQHYYRPHDPTYWQEFEERLEQTYRMIGESLTFRKPEQKDH